MNQTTREDIILYAAAHDFRLQTVMDWNLCAIAYAHGTAPRSYILPPDHVSDLRGVISLVAKCVALRAPQNTQRCENIGPTRDLLRFLQVNFTEHETADRAIPKCTWCRERMTPAHRLCKKNNVGTYGRVAATYDSSKHTVLKYITIYPPPPRALLPRFSALGILPQPIAEEIAEYMI